MELLINFKKSNNGMKHLQNMKRINKNKYNKRMKCSNIKFEFKNLNNKFNRRKEQYKFLIKMGRKICISKKSRIILILVSLQKMKSCKKYLKYW